MRPKKIILCVDDNEQDLSVMKFMLFTKGYKVISAIDGKEAMTVFAETPVDLVLADQTLPQMTGSQLLHRLKQMAPHVPMILLGDPQKMGGELHGADLLLHKRNCSSVELLEHIKARCTRKRGPRKGGSAPLPPAQPAVLAVAS
jgi:CheY-like chemotaxis protein